MAANFQPHMGVNGQMMPQQQQQQQQQQQRQQQRGLPNNGPNQLTSQIQQMIFQNVQANTQQLSGWQAHILIQERISLILNIIGSLRLASQHQQNPPTLQKMVEIGIKFEKDIFEKSLDKNGYKEAVNQKLALLMQRREQNQAGMQQSINMQAQAQAQAQAQQAAQAQQMMINQNSMQGQGPRNMPQQPAQQGFHHLQHQMQASPIPGQQPQQMPMGMSNGGMPQNMTQHQQQQFQIMMQQPQQQPQPPQNGPGGPQNVQQGQQPNQADAALIQELSNRLMNQASPDEKNQIRANLHARINQQQLLAYQQNGIDPLNLYYRNQAMQRLRQEKQARGMQPQQQPQNIPTSAPPMQQQRSMNPSPLNVQTQPPTSLGRNPDFGGFIENVGGIIDQQQQGVLAQADGQMVVPASGVRNATPQPGPIAGQQLNMNDQRAAVNPNSRTQQQQQMFNVQVQQQRMQNAAQQQSQAAARANAQAKAQQGLQGQPEGMGTGPMPPQQNSPMAMLNTPLRTPSQQMNHSETPQMNPNAQFGQPLDPRFMQGNQRQLGPGGNAMNTSGLNPAMFASMSQEQQARMATLPPDKLTEVVNKWNEQRQQQLNAQGRPQIPMQGNNQVRPGQQVPQPGQFNPGNALAQFMMANPGQRPPPSLTAGMSTQQQLMLQQQMSRVNSGQRNNPSNPLDQRIAVQMDTMDFPPAVLNHNSMPRGVPQEVKKWGALKQWAQNNPAVPPEAIEGIKNLQKLHWQQLAHRRQQPGQAQSAGVPAVLAPPAMVPPGMAAPVAQMIQNPMQNAMQLSAPQLRQPTPQDIQNARNSNPRFAGASDDQIRNWLMRNQMSAHQLQQRQIQMSQMNGQQPRPGAPPQTQQPGNSMGATQNGPKQAPSGTETVPTPTTASRVARPTQNGRPNAQNSSPAQPAKSLKRASSDDVVEVPNPNAQPPRPTAQLNQASKPVPHQNRPNLNPQQIAALDPEARKKYEAALRMFQASQSQNPQSELAIKLRNIGQEEAKRAVQDALPDIPMDKESKVKMQNLLRDIVIPLTKLHKIIPRWYQMTRDDNRARTFFRAYNRLAKQFVDTSFTQLKDSFSIRPIEVEQSRLLLNTMVQDLTAKFPGMRKSEGTQVQPEPPTSEAMSANNQNAPPSTVPLNAANLQQQQQQLSKMHQRSGSRSGQPPAAPTSSQPPFAFGASSPHGTPAYVGKPPVTREDLHIPARKKQRPNNNTPVQGTPGSNTSPQVNKTTSPEIKRQQPSESKVQQKPSLCCSEPECDRHNIGFDSAEALRQHTQDEHIRPLENPQNYCQENLACILGLDSQGKPKKPVTNGQETGPSAGAKMVTNSSKQGQTPRTPAGAATPMNRQNSMNRQPSANGAKPNPNAKDSSAKLQQGQKDSDKQSNQPTQAVLDPWEVATIDPNDIFQTFQGFESGAGGAISDMNVYRSITPNDTPESSKDGISEPNSDISEGFNLDIALDLRFDENWQPFGVGDADTLGDISNFNFGDEDIPMPPLDEEPPMIYQSWDDMVDQSAFDKPFVMDTSLFAMNVE